MMWVHSQLIQVEGVGYSQIIRAEKADVCRSYGLCLQATTPTDREIRILVQQMQSDNVGWGAPRIHGELLKLGFTLSQATVSNYLKHIPKPPITNLANLSKQPCRWHSGDGLLSGANSDFFDYCTC
jgi:hypothetical protein